MPTNIYINKEPIELFKILKFEGLAATGGEAKMLIANKMVQLNGTIEIQKRKKIVSGDEIEFNNIKYAILLGSA